jgi:N6-adenosine-specific RNA methylase IME4
MDLAEIARLPVNDIAAASAVLFLWVPPAILQEAFEIIKAWGFTYRTGSVWVKPDIGTGHYFRQQHEHLLLAARGDMPAPPFSTRPPSVFHAPRREHSRKPDEAYALIERMYPDLPKIELFARSQRPGWDAWGNEVPSPQEAQRESRGEMWARPFDFSKLEDSHGDEAPDDGMPDIPAFLRRAAP